MKEKNIIYPPIVEQTYNYFHPNQPKLTKAEVYKGLVKVGMLDEYGKPTQSAIKGGLVDEYVRVANGNVYPVSLKAFKKEYDIYKPYADSHFHWSDESGWVIDSYVMRAIANNALNDPESTEEQRNQAYILLEQAKGMN